MATTHGTFTVTSFEPTDFTPAVTTALPAGHVLMRKEFSGDIEGWSQTQFVHAFDPATSRGAYVAMEAFTGSIDGRSGTCNIAHAATARGGAERTDEYLVIVPFSGTGDLEGISGSGSIDIDADGIHHLRLDYDITG